MKRVPYMKDAHSRRVWLDRCPGCRAIWFDAGEPEATAGRDLHLEISAIETASACPVCSVPLHDATLAHAKALACVQCRGVHLGVAELPAVNFHDDPDNEPTLKPPALFECCICGRTFSLDQGDGVTCNGCAPSPTITGETAAPSRLARRMGLMSLLDELFF